MKILKALLMSALVAPFMSSCVNDGNSYSGFSAVYSNGINYANTTKGYIMFNSYGNWQLTQGSGNDWCSFDRTQGSANTVYTIPVTYRQNTSGTSRTAAIRLQDVDESDAYVTFNLAQCATRGDGSLGNAKQVKSITGDDGSSIIISYDDVYRPSSFKMTKEDNTLSDLTFNFATDTVLYVTPAGSGDRLWGKYDNGYQVTSLTSTTDTVGYHSEGSLGSTMAYNLEQHKKGGEYTAQGILLSASIPTPDSEAKFDSVRYLHNYADGTPQYVERMKPVYSTNSNRNQSVDVNQLVLGVEECNPYALLSVFRLVRSSSIMSEAKTANGSFVIATTLNADKSVSTMTVTNKSGGKVTYTFTY